MPEDRADYFAQTVVRVLLMSSCAAAPVARKVGRMPPNGLMTAGGAYGGASIAMLSRRILADDFSFDLLPL